MTKKLIDNSENSDLTTESKSHSQRNFLSSDGTHSTNASSKINSDSFKKEPKLTMLKTQSAKHGTLFKNTPKNGSLVQNRRSLRRPQKTGVLNHGQVMVNRWMGFLKSKLPQFDVEDEKIAR